MLNKYGLDKGLLESPWVGRLAALFLVFAIIFVGAKAVNALINFDTISEPPQNVITVNGEGKVSAAPDLATVSFTVSEDATTASQAQDAAAKKMNVALALLKEQNIADKDIKTGSYSVYPRYSNPAPCYYTDVYRPCPATESKIIGYTASQTVDVKVRDLDKTGNVLSKLGDAGISNLYGPNFTIENEDELRADARKDAIKKAKHQAEELASQLGVRLVRIVSYNEGGYYPGPYMKAMDSVAYGMGGEAATAPSVPAGENEIVSNVTITYEIR